MRTWITLAVSAISMGCAPSAGFTRLSPTNYEPRPADYPITLFTVSAPRCPFDEVATVAAGPSVMSAQPSNDVLLNLLRVQARKVGGDAIVRVRAEDTNEQNITAAGTHFSRDYTGTVIRFRDATCKE